MTFDAMINNILKYDDEEDSMLDDTNFGGSQSDTITSTLNEIIKNEMFDICAIWVQIGVPRSRRINRVDEIKGIVEEHISELFQSIKSTEKTTLDELKKYRNDKLKDINKMLNDLKLPPFELPEELSLVNIAKLLYYKYNELNSLKKERVNKWTELKSAKAQLSIQLGCENKPFNLNTGIPSDEELMNLQSHVLQLNVYRDQRLKEYLRYKKEFQDNIVELEYKPENSFEKSVFSENKFILSENNMKELVNFDVKLKKMYEKNQSLRIKMLDKLNSLWAKLSISETEQDMLLKSCKDSKPSTLALLKKEIDRLEEIKKQNIGLFIIKIRPEIEQWWEKCCISEEEINLFTEQYFLNETFDENLLTIHEEELERLQKLYNENEEIFVKCSKWRTYWVRLQELEIKSKDPNRFNNRGGALLQEEKERKQLQKGIPKLEAELKKLAKNWSVNHDNKLFTIYGKPIERYFTEYWESYNIQKENEKEKKKNSKKQELEAENRGIKNVQSVTNKRTPLKRGNTPVPNSPVTSEKIRKVDHYSSIKKLNSASKNKQSNDIVVKRVIRRNLEKILKPDLDKIISKNPSQKSELGNFECSLINESEFQSTKIEEDFYSQAFESKCNNFGFKMNSVSTRTRTRSVQKQSESNIWGSPLQDTSTILNSPNAKMNGSRFKKHQPKKPFYLN